MRRPHVMLLLVFSMCLASSLCLAAQNKFSAALTPKEEIAGVESKAKGKADFVLGKDGKSMSYKLKIKNLKDASAAHIHAGKKGENGPPVYTLFAGPRKEKVFSGTLSEGTIAEKDLTGPLQGKSLDDLVALMKSGGAYVNVHTDAHPDGEIRGQIK